jgi:hypothetical protein
MTTTEDRPTAEEVYALAIRARRLSVVSESRGAVEVLMAAGAARADELRQARTSLGGLLMRLAAEYDGVRGVTADDWYAAVGERRTWLDAVFALQRFGSDFAAALKLGPAVQQAWLEKTPDVLAHWIDPACRSCGGRGSTGTYGRMMSLCEVCRGTTRRRADFDHSPEVNSFCLRMLTEMDRKATRVRSRMAALLRTQ